MSEFNPMTIVAATEVLANFNSHSDMEVLSVQWGLAGRCSNTSKSARIADLSKIAIAENPEVFTETGRVSLARALVEIAIKIPKDRQGPQREKLIAGLRFDGFEVIETESEPSSYGASESDAKLVRMLPEDMPDLDFREAESEVSNLLNSLGFSVARGLLNQAITAFQRGEWSSANGELRNFYESYLNEMAVAFGCPESSNSKSKRDFLGELQPPFLLSDYNEWDANNQKPQFVQGLMSRMHPHGGHPGLSEEEDATFRLQISLVTARLFLRRFNQRKPI
jgi:hypothetical protein